MRIYSVFHVSLLKPADSKTSVQETLSEIDPTSQDAEFEVEKILDKQDIDDQLQFLIK